jgi:hypothetical protein
VIRCCRRSRSGIGGGNRPHEPRPHRRKRGPCSVACPCYGTPARGPCRRTSR